MNKHEEFVVALQECKSIKDILDAIVRLTHDIVIMENQEVRIEGKKYELSGLYVNMKKVENRNEVKKAHPFMRLFINVRSIVNKLYGDFIDKENLIATGNMYIYESIIEVLRGNRDKVNDSLKTDGSVESAIKLLSDINKCDELCNYVYVEVDLRIKNEIKQDKNNPNYSCEKNEEGQREYTRREYFFLDDDREETLEKRAEKYSKKKKSEYENKPYLNPAINFICKRYIPRLTRKQQEFCLSLMEFGIYGGDRDLSGVKTELNAGAIYDREDNLLYSRENVAGYIGRIKQSLEAMFEQDGFIIKFNSRGELILDETKVKLMEEFKERYESTDSYEQKMLLLIDFMGEMEMISLFGVTIQEMESYDIYDAIDFIQDHEEEILNMLE